MREVKRRIIDSVGCYFGGWGAEPCRVSREVAGLFRGRFEAEVWGTGIRCSVDWAGFSNGVAVRYLDFNDTYLSREPLHPSDIIPHLIAVAQAFSRSGRELIESVALAYEVGCRLCDSASLRVRGWDHVNYTMIACAVAVGRLMGLDGEKIRNALSISVVPHMAMRQTRAGEITMWKAAAASNACRNAVVSCLMAQAGMEGPVEPFTGRMGFIRQVAGGVFDMEPLMRLRDGAPPSKILETHIKYYPVEYHAQSAVEAALRIRGRIRLEDIDEIVVETFEAAYSIIGSGEEKWSPRTRETADHSLPYIVAASLIDGDVWLDTFSIDRISGEDVGNLIKRVKVVHDRSLDTLYPREIPNRIKVRLKDGGTVEEYSSRPRGHALNPMSDRELERKFHRLVAGVMDEERRDNLLRLMWSVDKLEDVGVLVEAMRTEAP